MYTKRRGKSQTHHLVVLLVPLSFFQFIFTCALPFFNIPLKTFPVFLSKVARTQTNVSVCALDTEVTETHEVEEPSCVVHWRDGAVALEQWLHRKSK